MIETKNLNKNFGALKAVTDLNLTIEEGDIFGFIGPNGAGKTTLMNILYGLYQPDSGTIRINGKDITIKSPLDSRRQGIGMVHQHFMLVQNHTVAENIALGFEKSPQLFPQRQLAANILRFGEKFNFNIDPSKKVWQLSAGEQQRV